jgi:hypothetical protein
VKQCNGGGWLGWLENEVTFLCEQAVQPSRREFPGWLTLRRVSAVRRIMNRTLYDNLPWDT